MYWQAAVEVYKPIAGISFNDMDCPFSCYVLGVIIDWCTVIIDRSFNVS
jgi:hypothetical protein